MRLFAEDGSLYSEIHSYGLLQIAIEFRFHQGVKIEETYFKNKALVSRKTYEKARLAYPDMPAADNNLEDWGASVLRQMAYEKKHKPPVVVRQVPNLDHARSAKAFCHHRMLWGERRDAAQWLKSEKHTLGEMSWAKSVRLARALLSLGCVKTWACEIESYEDGYENSEHLVIELPKGILKRKKIFRKLDRLVEQPGFLKSADRGERFAYVKLA